MTKQELSEIRLHEVSDRYYELFEKINDISNSEFPLVDFLNDIETIEFRDTVGFNIEAMYDDIEKIYNMFMYYLNKKEE